MSDRIAAMIAANRELLAKHPDVKTWADIDAHTVEMRLGRCQICSPIPADSGK